MKLLTKQFPHPPVTSSLLGPNILLSTLFSNTLSLCYFLNVTDQVSHPYIQSKYSYSFVYYNFTHLERRRKAKDS
jgi:hypothetical protein